MMVAAIRQDRMAACVRDVLKIRVRTPNIWSAQAFHTFPSIPSGPVAWCGFTAFRIPLTSVVDFILVNDLAGCKVYPTQQVMLVPITKSLSDVLVKEHPGVFGICTFTRAQAMKGGDVVELSESLFATVFSKDKQPSVIAREHQSGEVVAAVPFPHDINLTRTMTPIFSYSSLTPP